jgi:hypothetical protein
MANEMRKLYYSGVIPKRRLSLAHTYIHPTIVNILSAALEPNLFQVYIRFFLGKLYVEGHINSTRIWTSVRRKTHSRQITSPKSALPPRSLLLAYIYPMGCLPSKIDNSGIWVTGGNNQNITSPQNKPITQWNVTGGSSHCESMGCSITQRAFV